MTCPKNCDCSEGGDSLSWKRGYYPILKPDSTQNDKLSSFSKVILALKCVDTVRTDDSACNPNNNCTATWDIGINQNCKLCSKG